MLEPNLVSLFTSRFETLSVPYMVSGSVAATIYGEPRLTHDVDLIVVLDRNDAPRVAEAFPLSMFYCPPEDVIAVEAAREQRGHFNIIHHQTGFKADVYLSGRDPLHAWAFARTRPVKMGDYTLIVAPPEYVILRKLEFFREGGSEKHMRDIRAMLETAPELREQVELRRLVLERNLGEVWRQVVQENWDTNQR